LIENSRIVEIALETISLEYQSLKLLKNSIDRRFEQIVHTIAQSKGKVVMTGVGKSGIIAMKIAATLSSTGTPSFYLHAADAAHGDLGMVQENDVVIAISKSGNSSEIKDLIPFLKKKGNTVVGMTANPNSVLGKQADYLLYTPVEKEACPHNLAPTTSTTVQMVIGDAIAMSLMELNKFQSNDFAQLHPAGTLGKRLNLRVKDLLNDLKLPRVAQNTVMKDVIYEISDKRLGATIVEENGTVLGLITDGDIRRVLEKHESINGLIAENLMTKNPICIDHNTLAFDALRLMKTKKINHLVILENGETYKGIVHILNFIKEGLDG
jgi:arabinose-5-phosphate isomerase